jgi:hypothetical protein
MKCSAGKEICTSNNAVSKYRSPTSMIGCSKRCRQSRRGNNRAAHGRAPRIARNPESARQSSDLNLSGSDDLIGQRLESMRVLIDCYRSTGLTIIVHDFYSGGRHEMLHEINRRDVITNLLVWISGILKTSS